MKTYKLIVEYDGTNFHGFQCQTLAGRNRNGNTLCVDSFAAASALASKRQRRNDNGRGCGGGDDKDDKVAELRTVQGVLEMALVRLTGLPVRTLRVRGAGRTDRGVHAVGQVVAFDIPSDDDCDDCDDCDNDNDKDDDGGGGDGGGGGCGCGCGCGGGGACRDETDVIEDEIAAVAADEHVCHRTKTTAKSSDSGQTGSNAGAGKGNGGGKEARGGGEEEADSASWKFGRDAAMVSAASSSVVATATAATNAETVRRKKKRTRGHSGDGNQREYRRHRHNSFQRSAFEPDEHEHDANNWYWRLQKAINSRLPTDVSVRSATLLPRLMKKTCEDGDVRNGIGRGGGEGEGEGGGGGGGGDDGRSAKINNEKSGEKRIDEYNDNNERRSFEPRQGVKMKRYTYRIRYRRRQQRRRLTKKMDETRRGANNVGYAGNNYNNDDDDNDNDKKNNDKDAKLGDRSICSEGGVHTLRRAMDPPCLWICPWALDDNLMERACAALRGKHDFECFVHKTERSRGRGGKRVEKDEEKEKHEEKEKKRDNIVCLSRFDYRILKDDATKNNDNNDDCDNDDDDDDDDDDSVRDVLFSLEAPGFRRSMARNLVGFVIDLCRNKLAWEHVSKALTGEERYASLVNAAPACGLCLDKVEYYDNDYNNGGVM